MRLITIVCVSVLISWLSPGLVYAGPDDNPPPLPGWTHLESPEASAEAHGVVLPGASLSNNSAVIAEIDGDPFDGREAAIGGRDGLLYAFRADGSLLWLAELPVYSCPVSKITNKLFSTPAVGALFGDGVPYVVVGYGGFFESGEACGGGVAAVRGTDGQILWNFDLKGFDLRKKIFRRSHTVFSSPALADVDGDGRLEVGFGSFNQHIFMLEATGKVRWYYDNADSTWSSPGFADADGDGMLEMIMGSDITGSKVFNPPTEDGGYVTAFRTARRTTKRILFRDPTAILWQTHLDQVVMSSPVIADVLPESPGLEVVIGNGCFFPERTTDKRGKWVKVLRLSDGAELRTLPMQACASSSSAVGDLDDDGVLEIVSLVNGNRRVGGPGTSRMIAWKASGPTVMWEVVPRTIGQTDSFLGEMQSPVIADLDGNGSLEVMVANTAGVGIFNGRDGRALTCQLRECDPEAPYMLFTYKTAKSTPAVGDLNLDGRLDLLIGAGHPAFPGRGVMYAWTQFGLLASSPGAQPPYAAPWPMSRGNARHTGVYGDREP